MESGIKDHSNPFNSVKAGIILGKEDFAGADTLVAKAIAMVLSSPFGVGSARYRTGAIDQKPRYVFHPASQLWPGVAMGDNKGSKQEAQKIVKGLGS